jgi:hypothetical protein
MVESPPHGPHTVFGCGETNTHTTFDVANYSKTFRSSTPGFAFIVFFTFPSFIWHGPGVHNVFSCGDTNKKVDFLFIKE